MNFIKSAIGITLILLSLNANAGVSRQEVIETYARLIATNHLFSPPKLIISNNPEENAYSTGSSVVINIGIMNKLKNKDELARLLGHELGHHYLRHTTSNIPNEYAADERAMLYMTNAGYSRCKGAAYFLRRNSAGGIDHPSDYNRWLRFQC